jgi:nitroreductase
LGWKVFDNRTYRPTRLSEATVRTLLDAAVQAPSAMNAQPWSFAIVQDVERLRQYSERAKEMLRSAASADSKAQRYAERFAAPGFNIFYDASTLIVVCVDVPSPYTDADCWLAAQNLMLAARAKGLGSCPIGLAVSVLNTPEAKRELGIAPGGRAVAPIIIGVPSAESPPVPRNPPRISVWIR